MSRTSAGASKNLVLENSNIKNVCPLPTFIFLKPPFTLDVDGTHGCSVSVYD